MGVLSCSRNGCENIMCDTYVNGVGYICYECKNEFVVYCRRYDMSSDALIIASLMYFMNMESDRLLCLGNDELIDDFFNRYSS